ncbi:MAG: CidA/LrgA family protein [Phyllobacterium sp.]
MLQGLFVLLLCQLLGEGIAYGLAMPVPGPALGIILLVGFLLIKSWFLSEDAASEDTGVSVASDGLLRNLSLLFVPAGVGIAQNYDVVLSNGIAVAVALVVSAVLTLVATAAVFRVVSNAVQRRGHSS